MSETPEWSDEDLKEFIDGRTIACLKKHNVKVVNPVTLLLQCEECGHKWIPTLWPREKLPQKYWMCPNRCNLKSHYTYV